MQRGTLWLFGVFVGWCLVIGAGASFAAQSAYGLEPLVLSQARDHVSLLPHTAYLKDETGSLTLADVRTQTIGTQFKRSAEPVRVRDSDRVVWFRIHLRQIEFDGNWVLTLPFTNVSDLQFYGPILANGREVSEPIRTGTTQPYVTRPFANESYVMPVRLELPGDYTVYVRVQTAIDKDFEFKISDFPSFYQAGQSKRIFDGICYGIMIGLLVYNLSLWAVFHDRSYALYVLSGLIGGLTVASFNGHLAHYVLYDWPLTADRLDRVLPALWILTGVMFAHNFLDMQRYAPALGRLAVAIAVVSGVNALLGALGYTAVSQRLNELISLAGTVLVVSAGLLAWRHGYRPARLYLLGQFLLFFGVFLVVLRNWGTPIPLFFTDNGMQLGVSVELMAFALALSSRIRLMKEVQSDLLRKTQDLTVASETDPLTQLANRSGLRTAASRLLEMDRRRVLLLIDLDKFKPINDIHGHAAGDAMLVEVAQRLKALTRPEDVVARLGGDEFAILLAQAPSRGVLETVAGRILEALAQPLMYQEIKLQVGGSVGIAYYPNDGSNLNDLLHAADVAMYHVKRHGRGSFAMFAELTEKDAMAAVDPHGRTAHNEGNG